MLEENKTVELNDEELEKVSGGGSGSVPTEGIIFESYSFVSQVFIIQKI